MPKRQLVPVKKFTEHESDHTCLKPVKEPSKLNYTKVVCASLKALNEPEGSTHRKLFMHIYRNYPINTNKKKVVSKMMMILKRGEKRGLWKKIVAKRVLNNRYKLLKDISGEGTKKRKKLAIGGQWPQLNDATYNSSSFVSVQVRFTDTICCRHNEHNSKILGPIWVTCDHGVKLFSSFS